jgi:hypothetical protein
MEKRHFFVGLVWFVTLLAILNSVSAFTSWNSSYEKAYPINVTVLSVNRVNDLLQLNVTGLVCTNSDYRDLRILRNNTQETPYSLYSDTVGNKYAYITQFNASVGSYTWGYAYCNASGVSAPSYYGFNDYGYLVTGFPSGTSLAINITTSPDYKTTFTMYRGFLGTVSALNGFDNMGANGWGGGGRLGFSLATNGNSFKYGVTLTQTCTLQLNTSQYIRIECMNAANGINLTYHFFYGEKMFGVTAKSSYATLVSEFTSAGAGTTASQKKVYYHLSTGQITSGDGNPLSWYPVGSQFFQDGTIPLGFGQIWNHSTLGLNQSYATLRATTNDPDGCLMGGSSCGNSLLNLTRWTESKQYIWSGFANVTGVNNPDGMNTTFIMKMNPTSYNIGAAETNKLNLPPSTPNISNVPDTLHNRVIVINWTVSVSPDGDDISGYTLKLYKDDSFLRNLTVTTALNYSYNMTDSIDSNYRIYLYSIDVIGRVSNTSYSRYFEILEPAIPSSPAINSVSDMLQNTTQIITWMPSVSPQGTPIYRYYLNIFDSLNNYVGNVAVTGDVSFNFTGNYTEGYYQFKVYSQDQEGLFSENRTSNIFNITTPCVSEFACTQYAYCGMNNVSVCNVVSDVKCGYAFGGNVSDYDISCVYVSPVPTGAKFDLNTTTGALVFGIMVFFWLALLVISFIFRSFATVVLMWAIGVLLGFWLYQFGAIWSIGFMLLDTALVMTLAKSRR